MYQKGRRRGAKSFGKYHSFLSSFSVFFKELLFLSASWTPFPCLLFIFIIKYWEIESVCVVLYSWRYDKVTRLGIQIRSSEKLACNFARVYYLDMHQKGGEIYLSLTQFANAKYIKPDGMISWLPSAGNRLRLQAMTKVALLFGGEAISVEKIVWS